MSLLGLIVTTIASGTVYRAQFQAETLLVLLVNGKAEQIQQKAKVSGKGTKESQEKI